jgi:hypothetical protein
VGQVLNGNGIPAAEDRVFDVDTEKAGALRASQSLGPVRVGAFGYYNAEKNEFGTRNEVYYAGGDATIGGASWEVNLQYLRREDSNAWFVRPDSTDTTTDGGFAVLGVIPGGDRSRWAFVAMYNAIESDGDLYDTRRATASASHMAARNLRFLLEYTWDLEVERSEFVLGAMAAF